MLWLNRFLFMAKTKEQKKKIITGLNEAFAEQKALVLLDFGGVDSKTLFKLRDELKAQNCQLKVVKKTLLRKALEKTEEKDLLAKLDELQGQLALAFGFSDEVAPAKICYKYTKENEQLKIIGGILNQHFNNKTQIIALAQLPSKKELLAQIIGVLQAPVSGFAHALKGNLSNLVYALNEIQKVKK